MTDDVQAQCRAALLDVCPYNGEWIDCVDDVAAAIARAIVALRHDDGDNGPCPVCTDRALAAIRRVTP